MNIFRCAVLAMFLTASVSVRERTHQQGDDAFENILKTMNLTNSLDLQSVTTIVKQLEIHDCSNKTSHRHKCVKAHSLFGFFNISTKGAVNETGFARMATILVYSLLPRRHYSESNMNRPDERGLLFVTEKIDVHKELLERYKTSVLCRQILDQLLKDINESIEEQQITSPCFSSHDILYDLNISTNAEITRESLPQISTIIVSRLLDRQCIKVENETPLPCPSFFVDDLFNKYAKNDVINKEDFEKLLKNLGIGKPETKNNNNNQDHHDSHDNTNRRRRHVITERSSQSPDKTLAAQEEQTEKGGYRQGEAGLSDHATKYKKCYSVDEIFSIYDVDKKSGVDVLKFKLLSSSLFHQVATDACVVEAREGHSKKSDIDHKRVWGFGVLCVSMLSVCSMVGITVVPLISTVFYQKLVSFLIALAVATSVGDALIHLLPQAFGLHGSHDEGNSSSSHEEDRSHIWVALVAAAGIYAFFVFESITHNYLGTPVGHSHSVEHTPGQNKCSDIKKLEQKTEVGMKDSKSRKNESVTLVKVPLTNQDNSEVWKDDENSNIDGKKSRRKRIRSAAWVITFGDAVCNFADGIAIGVAFTGGIPGGISTAIAVFCHELPHELGTFAVLLSTGMNMKEALVFNFLASLSCFLGLVSGILIGENQDVSPFVFGISAGVFVYIALADMLPELMHSSQFNAVSKKTLFLLQNTGMLIGLGIMVVLAYYEENIHI